MQQFRVDQGPGGHGHRRPQSGQDRGARHGDADPAQTVRDVVVRLAQRGTRRAAAGDQDQGAVGEGHRRQGRQRGPRGAARRGGRLDQRAGGGQGESGELRPGRAEPEACGVPGVEQETGESRHESRRQQRESGVLAEKGAREQSGGGDQSDGGEQPVGVVEQGESMGDEDDPEHGQDTRRRWESGQADDEDRGGDLDGEAQGGPQRLQIVDEADDRHEPGPGEQPSDGARRVARRTEPQGRAGRRAHTEHGGRAARPAQRLGPRRTSARFVRDVGAERHAAGTLGECDRDEQRGHTGGDDPQHVHLPCLSSFMTCRPVPCRWWFGGHRTPPRWRFSPTYGPMPRFTLNNTKRARYCSAARLPGGPPPPDNESQEASARQELEASAAEGPSALGSSFGVAPCGGVPPARRRGRGDHRGGLTGVQAQGVQGAGVDPDGCAGRAQRHRAARASRPSTKVRTISMSPIREGSTRCGSSPSTTRSARIPGARAPAVSSQRQA